MVDDRDWLDLEKTWFKPSCPMTWLLESVSSMDADGLAMLTLHLHCPTELLLSLLRVRRRTSSYGWINGRRLAEIACLYPNLGASVPLEALQQLALESYRSSPPSRGKWLALLSPIAHQHCSSGTAKVSIGENATRSPVTTALLLSA